MDDPHYHSLLLVAPIINIFDFIQNFRARRLRRLRKLSVVNWGFCAYLGSYKRWKIR